MSKPILAGAFAALACVGAAQAAEMALFTTVRNTDVAAFGIGQLRDAGSGTLNVSGVTGPVSSAYLFWAGPTNSADPLVNASVSFGGANIAGVNIGFSHDNSWGRLNSQAYRADVTSIVTGNGAYALANFDKLMADINGASLIVFHDDGVAANNRDIVLFNGNDANGASLHDADGWNALLSGFTYAGGPASLTLHVSDGQQARDGELILNGTTLASGDIFDGVGGQLGDGTDLNSLWDVNTFDVTGMLTSGANTLTLPLLGDNVALIVTQLSLPASPLDPGSGAVPEPRAWALMILGFGLAGAALRRRTTRALAAT